MIARFPFASLPFASLPFASLLLTVALPTGDADAAMAARAAPAAAADATRRVAGEVLFWSQAERDRNFRAMETLVTGHAVRAGARHRRLPPGLPIAARLGGEGAVGQIMDELNIAGLLVLQGGGVRLERYARGFSASQRWTSFSVAKSITSTLVGEAIAAGSIRSVEDPITRYIPELAGSGYAGVTIAQVLTMTSGVRWNEDYTDPQSDVVRLFRDAPPPGKDPTVAYLKRLPREAPPGSRWHYNTGETSLIGVLVRKATGQTLASYLSERIWRPYGMERDAFWQADGDGQEPGGCCLSATLRDFGRFGQFMLDGGRIGQRATLPDGWIAAATAVQQPLGGGQGYGYQWWTSGDGTYRALGIYGQMIHLDPARRMVIVTVGAWPEATSERLSALRRQLIDRITAAADATPPKPATATPRPNRASARSR